MTWALTIELEDLFREFQFHGEDHKGSSRKFFSVLDWVPRQQLHLQLQKEAELRRETC